MKQILRSFLTKPWFCQNAFHIASPTLRGRALAAALGIGTAIIFYFVVNFILLTWASIVFVPQQREKTEAIEIFGSDNLEIRRIAESDESTLREYHFATNSPAESEVATDDVRLYWIKSNGDLVMQIEIRREGGFFKRRIVADIALPAASHDAETLGWKRISWWTFNDLAKSNSIAQYSAGPGLPTPEYPTNTNAIVTWIKTHWVKTVDKAKKHFESDEASAVDNSSTAKGASLSKSDVRDFVAPELQRILTEDFGHLSKCTPLVCMRVLNGAIQFLIFSCFFAAVFVAFARYCMYVIQENLYIRAIQRSSVGKEQDLSVAAQAELLNVEELQLRHSRKFGRHAESPSLQIWSGSLNALRREGDYGDVPAFLNSFKDLAEGRLISSGFFLRFLIGAMPGLGFVGTVIGIPGALMETGSVLSDELAKQQSGVTNVALALAFAFDTTLIGLVFALIGQYVMFLLNAAEETTIQNAAKACLSSFVGQAEAPVGSSEEPKYRESTISREVGSFDESVLSWLESDDKKVHEPDKKVELPIKAQIHKDDTAESYQEKFENEIIGQRYIALFLAFLFTGALTVLFVKLILSVSFDQNFLIQN